MGTAPALVAVSSTVTVLLVASQDDVESTNMVSLAEFRSWARRIIGVVTSTAQQSALQLVKTSVPAQAKYIWHEACKVCVVFCFFGWFSAALSYRNMRNVIIKMESLIQNPAGSVLCYSA